MLYPGTLRWVLSAVILVVAGCDKAPKRSCTSSCGQADASVLDASAIDAKLADAHPDGMPDAMPDASPDARPDANTCPALAIMDDGTQGAGGQDVVISLVQPNTGGKLELYNTTGADIDLSVKPYQLVSATQSVSLTGTVKSHGYLSVDWTFGDQTGGGEVVLYQSAAHTPATLDDFICWDTDGAGASSAEADAQSAAKWNSAGTCAGALTGTAIERKTNVTGINGTDYDSASLRAPRTCP